MKKPNWLVYVLAVAVLLTVAIPAALAADVVQGICVSYDAEKKILVITDELDKKDKTFDASTAKIGATPEKGNVIRVAFQSVQGKNVALKVMNVSKQDIRK